MWKDIPGYEGYYQASRSGLIRRTKGRTAVLVGGSGGGRSPYRKVTLCKDGKQVQRTVHTLVARTFLPAPKAKFEVNHKDCNKLNNHVDNLEWVSRSENAKHAFVNGLRISPQVPRPVVQLGLDLSFVAEYPSVTAAADKRMKLLQPNIRRACERNKLLKIPKFRSTKFIWVYKEQYEKATLLRC